MANKLQRLKRKKEGQSNNYFSEQTEAAILQFQLETDPEIKKEIFTNQIRPAFDKLIENIVFVYQFHSLGNLEILKNDCMSFLFESLPKFDGSKGHKAFSYYNVVTRNWFSQRKKNHTKRSHSDIQFDQTVLAGLEKEEDNSVIYSYEDELFQQEFSLLLKAELQNWRNKFEKPQEKMILEAIILLLDRPDVLPLYNKKSIYMYLREITGMNTKQIVTNLAKFRKRYETLKNRYLAGEI